VTDAGPSRTPLRELGVVRAEPVDTGQLAGIAAEPAEVGDGVVVGLEDVKVPRG
jgi:hypothetical protein